MKSPVHINNHKQSGMTLLEVLVAMTLMVIISAISYASLNGLIDAKIHTDNVAKQLRQEILTSQQLSKDIHALIYRKVKNEFGATVPAVIGSYSNLKFSRNGHVNPLNIFRSDLQRVHWFVKDHQLFRSTLDSLDIGSFSQWKTRKYLDKVSEFSMNFTNSRGQESRVWPRSDASEGIESPLRFIQFNLEFDNGTTLKYFLKAGM